MRDETIDLIYIGGCGRSGSTLLLRTLGCMDSFLPMGEVRRFWRIYPEDNLCGCGEPVVACSFWSDLIQHYSLTNAREVRGLQKNVERKRNIPDFFGFPGSGCSNDQLKEYRSKVKSVYNHARSSSDAHVLVDSSKRGPYAYLLKSMPSINLYLIHLVRDARAVANSNLRQKTNPTRDNPERVKPTTKPSRVARRWNRRNLFMEGLKPFANHALTLRYETFVKHPRKTIKQILSAFDFDHKPDLPFTGNRHIQLEPEHILESNPMRFKTGDIEIQLDDRWRQNLDPYHRRTVTAMTWPLLLKYGYRVFPLFCHG